jgi:hypothetical protein
MKANGMTRPIFHRSSFPRSIQMTNDTPATKNQENPSLSLGTMLLSFLAGAAAGAVVVALTTRKTGPEFRRRIQAYGRLAKLKAGNLAEEVSGTWDGMKERTVLAANDLKRGVNDAANDLRG